MKKNKLSEQEKTALKELGIGYIADRLENGLEITEFMMGLLLKNLNSKQIHRIDRECLKLIIKRIEDSK